MNSPEPSEFPVCISCHRHRDGPFCEICGEHVCDACAIQFEESYYCPKDIERVSYINAEGLRLPLDPGNSPDQPFACGYCEEPVTLRTGVSSSSGTVHPECRDEMEDGA